jgi:hypothetical protein
MFDLSVNYGFSHYDAVRSHVLSKMRLIEFCLQPQVLPVQEITTKLALCEQLHRLGHHSPVRSILFSCLLPKSQHFVSYLCRATDSEEWNKKRRINNLKPNLVVDFQDNTNTWRRGVVASIFDV